VSDFVAQSVLDTRRHQAFPTLTPADIERMRRFGTPRSYAAGDTIVSTGDAGRGLTIILAGKVDITQRDSAGHRTLIVVH
jgi:thioredoxin reductase (NADPH)